MRKPLPLLLAVPLALALGACEGDGPAPIVEEPTASATEEEPSPTEPPPDDPEDPEEPGPPEPPEEEPSPQSTADFGEPLGFTHAVGPDGEGDGDDGSGDDEDDDGEDDAEVVYTVDGVERPWASRVDFTVTVHVPDLGRTFSLAEMEVVCEAGPEIPIAQTEEPLYEVPEGTYSSRMWCEIPEDADRVRIVVMNGDDEAAFGGEL
ncbi:hypothetical protein IDM40_02035 [Nocardiopsis sp. HNM0947]|uniref:Lipoprotein n=1 Tax=Nocardiopsis coralli TaxID=2772213 RepID=A0ABR9P143_9ACTN|nr:hypothetical protein [Nocardiopsis coralli]MBE2997485.1 hypothetical protein [Nocardiopsis coralli]